MAPHEQAEGVVKGVGLDQRAVQVNAQRGVRSSDRGDTACSDWPVVLADLLATHSDRGAANTMRGVQARRPSFYDLEDGLKKMMVPTLVIVGDEDDHCLQPGIFLKKTIPACGLSVFPKTGHTLNLEEPAAFNALLAEFIAQVEAGHWMPRDPRALPGQIMRTK